MKRLLCAALGAAMLSAMLCGCGSESAQSSIPATESVSAATVDEPAASSAASATGSKIRVNDSTLGEIWITELSGVPKNTLKAENFTSDDTFKYYSENGNPASEEGIDISSYSGDVDWARVKAAGVDFVMVRLGGRGYGEEGSLYSDDRALEYIQGAQAAGIKAGGYFFSQAITEAEAVEEAEYVKTLLGDIKLEYPVAFDWEIIKDDAARTDDLSGEQATKCARAFCEAVKGCGYKPMIYSTSRELYFKYDLTQLADYDLWYCEYADLPSFYYQFDMWQYSKSGTVDGVDGTVDLNICFTGVSRY